MNGSSACWTGALIDVLAPELAGSSPFLVSALLKNGADGAERQAHGAGNAAQALASFASTLDLLHLPRAGM
jgi:hypothetical protein